MQLSVISTGDVIIVMVAFGESVPAALEEYSSKMSEYTKQKVIVVGAGPVGALAALYAAGRGDDVEVYELRSGRVITSSSHIPWLLVSQLHRSCSLK